ncbi:MAG: hypothetical protein A3E78_16680 [Alphaproteobacteria bacterium RIFCSPHIGHO2_12_FULL_63_12]|nr:MAG: hypothetical protein A3E78_16680 [Alphaproteobacteria bacterium RIFCSPHIGHO2_12_FULL_63_12]
MQIIDETVRPLDLSTRGDDPDLKVGARVFVPFTVLNTRDRGQISLQASDGRIFNASIGCLNDTGIVQGYESPEKPAVRQEPPDDEPKTRRRGRGETRAPETV